MKIIATKKEDILRRKAEWQEQFDIQKKAHDEEYRQYRQAQESSLEPTKKAIEDILNKYDRLDADIRVEEGAFGSPGARVRISCNERNLSDPTKSLSWSYDAYMTKDGEIKRETSSWSGLQAVTSDQIEHLQQCVNCLKELSNLDWKSVLDVSLPEYKDYIKTPDPSWSSKPDFDKELMEAELEDIIGDRKMVEVQGFPGSWYYDSRFIKNRNVFIAIVKDSGSQYTIKECPLSAVERGEASKYFDSESTHRVKKDSIKLVKPLNIIDV